MNVFATNPTVRGIRTLTRAAIDFVYPPSCPFCGREVDRADGELTLECTFCDECRAQIAPPLEQVCERCGAPVGPHLETSAGCGYCRSDRYQFERAVALGVYAEGMRQACRRAKSASGAPLAAALADLLWRRRRADLERAGIDFVVAVPRHWTRRIGQGHNASETLAAVLARRLQVPCRRHILSKVRRTPLQATLSPTRRRTNLRGAFRARGSKILAGATVLLVDDILTTGTTANEATRALRNGGADRVVAAVGARGIGR